METTTVETPYLTYDEAAAYCCCDRTTLWRAVKSGALRASGPGTRVVFDKAELRRWMDSKGSK
jgi:excisionase family DNA binding protein